VAVCGAGDTAVQVNWVMEVERIPIFLSMFSVCFLVLFNLQQETIMHAWFSQLVA
jgi:hypothetical protein